MPEIGAPEGQEPQANPIFGAHIRSLETLNDETNPNIPKAEANAKDLVIKGLQAHHRPKMNAKISPQTDIASHE